jgi:dihydroorotase
VIESLNIPKPDDFHVHLRQGSLLKLVTPFTAAHFSRALVMPNTEPPILTARDAVNYAAELRSASPQGMNFQPLTTIKLTKLTTNVSVENAAAVGVLAAKFYPQGMTTNASDGPVNLHDLQPGVLDAMQESDLVLCVHAEAVGVFCLDREIAFLPELDEYVRVFPRLRIVLEHLSTRGAVEAVEGWPANVAATVTPHHLVLTLDDLIGSELHPHSFCKPVPKTLDDQRALIRAVTSGKPKFFLGTDSAPHWRTAKEESGAAGIFNAPVALQVLAQVFEDAGALGRLGDFVAAFGADFYRLPRNRDRIELVRRSVRIPNDYEGIVPLWAGREARWSLTGQTPLQ